MSAGPTAVQFTLPARPENVAVVRHALAGLADAIGMSDGAIADLKTVVTEACMNAVLHAYEDDEGGTLEVVAETGDSELDISVRDFGHGIRPRPATEDPHLRLGLPLIAALSSRFEIRGGPERGTEVRITMALDDAGREETGDLTAEAGAEARETVISLPAGELVAPIVSRVISIIGARAELSVDRLSDAVLLGDAISSGGGEDFPDGRLRIAIDEGEGAVDVRIGPLREGASERILGSLQVPGLGSSLQALADEVRVESDDGESVVLRIGPR